MKTKPIPSVIMLIAGGIRCVAGAIYKEDTTSFLWSLILTMILFYILGIIVKIVLDKNFNMMLEDAPQDENGEAIEGEEMEEDLEDVEEQGLEESFVKEKTMEETDEALLE